MNKGRDGTKSETDSSIVTLYKTRENLTTQSVSSLAKSSDLKKFRRILRQAEIFPIF